MDFHLLSGRPIYFPFLSGMLEYDCTTCDSRCCKGGALGIGRSKELVGLLHIAPPLALFAAEGFPRKPLPVLETVLEQCWFLDRENKCRLERAVGRQHKPAGCRMFPFNQFRGATEWVVVMPHFLCPLVVNPEPVMEGPTSHDGITLEMHAVGVPRDGHPELVAPSGISWMRLIPMERRIRDGGRNYLLNPDYTSYANYQADLTTLTLHTPQGPSCDVLRARIAACLGYGDGRPSAPRVHDLVVLTPYLRLRASTAPIEVLPNMLTALSVMVAALEQMQGTQWSTRTLVQLFEKRALLLVVLAHLLDIPLLREGYTADALVRGDPLAPGPLAELLNAIEDNDRCEAPASLSTLLARLEAFQPPMRPEAVGALVRLGRYIPEALQFEPPE